MTRIAAFGFDLDGTLVETEALKARSYLAGARMLDRRFDRDDEFEAMYGSLVGRSREEVAGAMLRQFDLEPAARAWEARLGLTDPVAVLAQLHVQAYNAMLDDPALVRQQIYPATIDLLRHVRREKFRIGLATMSHVEHAQRVVDILEVRSCFDVILTRNDVERPKPDPTIYLMLAERLGVTPAGCLVVEDSLPGVQAALAAGTTCVAVPTAYTRASVQAAEVLPPERVVDPVQLAATVSSILASIG